MKGIEKRLFAKQKKDVKYNYTPFRMSNRTAVLRMSSIFQMDPNLRIYQANHYF